MDPRLNTEGPTLIVVAEHKPPVYDRSGVRLVTASVRRPGPDVLDPRIHHANATHLFVVSDGEVVTPRVVACPAGITRATVLELCQTRGTPAVERDLSLAELYRADEAFCSGTMGELVPGRRGRRAPHRAWRGWTCHHGAPRHLPRPHRTQRHPGRPSNHRSN